MNEHYQAVLNDLLQKREPLLKQMDDLAAKIEEFNLLIEGIRTAMTNSALGVSGLSGSSSDVEPPSSYYKHMSMRWAILRLLADHCKGEAMPTSSIADCLIRGGFAQSSNFNSKVSAILSQMLGKGEVEKKNQDWAICGHGREVWDSIKKGDKYATRHLDAPNDLE
jgi:hypothetical protein